MNDWTREQAIELATKIEAISPSFGFHIALTGGLLYKDGPRKDADFILWNALRCLGIETKNCDPTQFVEKATYRGKGIDFMFPEVLGQYVVETPKL